MGPFSTFLFFWGTPPADCWEKVGPEGSYAECKDPRDPPHPHREVGFSVAELRRQEGALG